MGQTAARVVVGVATGGASEVVRASPEATRVTMAVATGGASEIYFCTAKEITGAAMEERGSFRPWPDATALNDDRSPLATVSIWGYEMRGGGVLEPLAALVGEKFEHHFAVVEVSRGPTKGLWVAQIWSGGDVEMSGPFKDREAAVARGIKAGVVFGAASSDSVKTIKTKRSVKTFADFYAAVSRVKPHYKLVGSGAHNCQHVSREVYGAL